jgi:predicted O-methyltransferase YrrM
MYSRFQLASKYLNYYFTASNGRGHGIHSPLVFEFITKVLNNKEQYEDYNAIENIRHTYLRDETTVTINDFGAGSSRSGSKTRTIRSIARHAVKSRKFGQLLYRIVKYYQPVNILELGTSLGITTSYLAKGIPTARVVTFEGSEEVLNRAKSSFATLELKNVETVAGNFDDKVLPVVDQLPSVDFAFIDGNHRLEPTTRYFNTLLSKINNSSIIILDDIHWSREMEQAWTYCKDHSSVTLSIDLFFIGILIFRREIMEKQHFAIRF